MDYTYEKYPVSFNKGLEEARALLPTAMVKIVINGYELGPVRVLIDTGAQINMITFSLQQRYSIITEPIGKMMVGIEGNPLQVSKKARLVLRPWYSSNVQIKDEFWVLPKESQWSPVLPSPGMMVGPIHNGLNGELADPKYWEPESVHMLLGASLVARIVIRVVRDGLEGIALMETALGVVVFGECAQGLDEQTGELVSTVSCNDNRELDKLLTRFWEMEQVKECSGRTEEEELVEKIFLDTYFRDSEGRFVVTIPLKEVRDIGSSKGIALRRFLYLERRLEREPELRAKYIEFMREYEELGHMKMVDKQSGQSEMTYYIPHHCVVKKFRVVFDASCRTNKGISLNEVQLLGGKLQKDLSEIVMRFRRHRVAFSADIKMMFRQIGIARDQWDMQRIFWREGRKEPLKEYWLTVVTYGMTSSAYNAVRSVIQCARDAQEDYPEAAEAIINDMYMDDCVTGANSEQDAITLAQQMDRILKGAGFSLRKWRSNSKELMRALDSSEQDLLKFEDETRVLGLVWLVSPDQYAFVVKTPELPNVITKRVVVSCVAQLFDPNGYISPVIVIGKILIQDLWRSKLEWDEKLPSELEARFKDYWNEMKNLEDFRMPRWLGTHSLGQVELHGFADASESAYGAVIYARTVQDNGKVECRIIVSKTRVSPVKKVTIPRLELSACELLSRLLLEVKRAMNWSEINYTLWTDSLVVLYWLEKIPRDLKTFVANRVSTIQDNTTAKNWKHVRSEDNPADLLSRGLRPGELVTSGLWLNGPEWLSLPRAQWPADKFEQAKIRDCKDTQAEFKVNIISTYQAELEIFVPKMAGRGELIPLTQYKNKLEGILNVLGYVKRFIDTIKERWATRDRSKRPYKRSRLRSMKARPDLPTEHEKLWAMEYLLKNSQQKHFPREMVLLKSESRLPEHSKIESLHPILDKNGILRVGGRLAGAGLEYEARHQAIVAKGSRLAFLIADYAHRQTKHGAVQVMTNYIRQKYWIPRLRDELRKLLHKCVVCVRYNYKLGQQLMADLPTERVHVGKPFLHCGLDYAGPFGVRVRVRDDYVDRTKCWVAVFVCLKTRAVHIDLVLDLTTQSFIACYERFIGRRGRCAKLFSDNATTFVGASKMMKRAIDHWRGQETLEHLAMKGTEWRFMIPAAPHQGGIYEAAVKSMKFHLTRIVGQKTLAQDQLATLLVEIEAILNSRPLYPLTDDPNDVQALTPGHFLIGEPLILPPPFMLDEQPKNVGTKIWAQRQAMIQHFWNRWQVDYLNSLQERKKWRRERENLKVGQMVIIKAENFPPAQWALGRIIELIHSNDKLVRSVVVQTQTSKLTRPVQKVCVLPVEPDMAEQQ